MDSLPNRMDYIPFLRRSPEKVDRGHHILYIFVDGARVINVFLYGR